jgi:hypothetical protein
MSIDSLWDEESTPTCGGFTHRWAETNGCVFGLT